MYKLNESEVTIEGKNYVVYGIECDGICVDAISTDKSFVEKLVCDFNNGCLAVLQMKEAIEDAVTDEERFLQYTKKL